MREVLDYFNQKLCLKNIYFFAMFIRYKNHCCIIATKLYQIVCRVLRLRSSFSDLSSVGKMYKAGFAAVKASHLVTEKGCRLDAYCGNQRSQYFIYPLNFLAGNCS